MIDRRLFVGALALNLAGASSALRSQPAPRIHRLGVLRPTPPLLPGDPLGGLLEAALRELDYAVGRNLVIESRSAGGDIDRLPELARELVRSRVDVIFAVGTAAIHAARAAAPTLPIVFFGNLDPVAAGWVRSLARPGRNVTGVLIGAESTLAAKRLQLLKEALPRATRIAVLAPDDPGFGAQAQEVRTAATVLGVALVDAVVSGGDYERAFASALKGRAEAMFVGATTYAVRDRQRIIELAAKHRLPATYEWPEQARDGGFMAYGTSLQGTYQRIASYLDRILRGERPGELPVLQPTEFRLVINLKTAKALGLTIPHSVLLRADEVIQ